MPALQHCPTVLEPLQMGLGMKQRRIRRQRVQHPLFGGERSEGAPVHCQIGQVLAIHVLLPRQLLERRPELLPIQDQQADEDLVPNRLRLLGRSPEPGVERTAPFGGEGVDPPADVAVPLVEAALDQPLPSRCLVGTSG